MPSTWPPSPRSASKPPAGSTTTRNSPKVKPKRKPSARETTHHRRRLPTPHHRPTTRPPPVRARGTLRNVSVIQRPASHPEHRLFGSVTPDPSPSLRDTNSTRAETHNRAQNTPLDTKRLRYGQGQTAAQYVPITSTRWTRRMYLRLRGDRRKEPEYMGRRCGATRYRPPSGINPPI